MEALSKSMLLESVMWGQFIRRTVTTFQCKPNQSTDIARSRAALVNGKNVKSFIRNLSSASMNGWSAAFQKTLPTNIINDSCEMGKKKLVMDINITFKMEPIDTTKDIGFQSGQMLEPVNCDNVVENDNVELEKSLKMSTKNLGGFDSLDTSREDFKQLIPHEQIVDELAHAYKNYYILRSTIEPTIKRMTELYASSLQGTRSNGFEKLAERKIDTIQGNGPQLDPSAEFISNHEIDKLVTRLRKFLRKGTTFTSEQTSPSELISSGDRKEKCFPSRKEV